MNNLYRQIWFHLSIKRRLQFYFLVILTIISAFLEIISIGLLVPFLSLLTNSGGEVNPLQVGVPIVNYFKEIFGDESLLFLTLVFVLMTVIANSVRLILMWLVTSFSTNVGGDFSVEIFKKTLNQPYQNIIQNNSSELISAITHKVNSVTYSAILPIVNIITSILILLGIFGALLYVNLTVTGFLFLFITLLYLTIFSFTKKRLISNSKNISKLSTHVVKVIQESLGGIRDIIVDGTQAVYHREYKKTEDSLRGAVANNLILAILPRYVVEGIGVSIIALIGYVISTNSQSGGSNAIPLLGVIALGAQRMLPALQQIYQSWAAIEGGKSSSLEAIALLNLPFIEEQELVKKKIEFKNLIEFKDVDFVYSGSQNKTLKKINLKMFKGQHIGIIGKSGSGKSTLVDILLGLLIPSEGGVFVDGVQIDSQTRKSWQSKLTHVSQNVYITDGSILENIAFGVNLEKIDFDLAKKCAEICQLSDLIESYPERYQTRIGERGSRLSGGQRQRIGIARALYRSREIIVFDEATSALDYATEKKIIDAIINEYQHTTMIFIAHRISTLASCASIIEINSGEISRVCGYGEVNK